MSELEEAKAEVIKAFWEEVEPQLNFVDTRTYSGKLDLTLEGKPNIIFSLGPLTFSENLVQFDLRRLDDNIPAWAREQIELILWCTKVADCLTRIKTLKEDLIVLQEEFDALQLLKTELLAAKASGSL